MKRISFLILLILIVSPFLAKASVVTAVTDGQWGNGTTWNPGVPGCYDTIVIPAGITVNIGSTVDITGCPDSMLFLIWGTLTFTNGRKLKLPCDSDVVIFPGASIIPGSGGGNSNYLEMCGTNYWNAGDGTLSGPAVLCDGDCPGSQLPIELLFFTAEWDDDYRIANLHWATASEADNDYFTVERSPNGEDWLEIVQVNGADNSSQRIDYKEVDTNPLNYGDSYYRLKQTDFNGEFSYSPIVRLGGGDISDMNIYPNPANDGDQVVINLPKETKSPVDLSIISLDGKIVYRATFDLTDTNQIIVDIDLQFTPGVYFVKTDISSAKLVVQ